MKNTELHFSWGPVQFPCLLSKLCCVQRKLFFSIGKLLVIDHLGSNFYRSKIRNWLTVCCYKLAVKIIFLVLWEHWAHYWILKTSEHLRWGFLDPKFKVWPRKFSNLYYVPCFKSSTFSDFIWPFLQPFMGGIPNPKMALFFPTSGIFFPN